MDERMEIRCCVVGNGATNCYLAKNKESGEAFIIDPGANGQKILNALQEMGGKAVAILLTHGHYDHILAVNGLKQTLGVPVYASASEVELLQDPDYNMSSHFHVGTSVEPDVLITGGDVLDIAGFSIRCISTPGHTKGSCCFYVEREGVLFSGDTLFKESVGRTDFHGGSTEEILRSVHMLVEMLPEDTRVYPGHEGMTSIGYEKRYNPFV